MLAGLEFVGIECNLTTSTFTADAVMTYFGPNRVFGIEASIGSICLGLPSRLAIGTLFMERKFEVSPDAHVDYVDYNPGLLRGRVQSAGKIFCSFQFGWKLLTIVSGCGACLAMTLNYSCWGTPLPVPATAILFAMASAMVLILYAAFAYGKPFGKWYRLENRELLKINDADIPMKSLVT